MNKMTKVQVAKRQDWVMQLITTITEKFFSWICSSEVSTNTFAGQEFFCFGGYGWEEARMYQTLVHLKMNQESASSNHNLAINAPES